jgi:hypothetical protein
MGAKDLVSAFIIGGILIALGMVPGLFQRLSQRVQEAIENFSALISSPYLLPHSRQRESEKLSQPLWLAGVGLALILLSLLAYRSNV